MYGICFIILAAKMVIYPFLWILGFCLSLYNSENELSYRVFSKSPRFFWLRKCDEIKGRILYSPMKQKMKQYFHLFLWPSLSSFFHVDSVWDSACFMIAWYFSVQFSGWSVTDDMLRGTRIQIICFLFFKLLVLHSSSNLFKGNN